MEKQKEGEETQRLLELYESEERVKQEREEKQKRDLLHAHKVEWAVRPV